MSELNFAEKLKCLFKENVEEDKARYAVKKKAYLKESLDDLDDGIDLSIDEEQMTPKQKNKREEIVMSMKDKEDDFKKKYGKNWKNVMYATATKMAMAEEAEQVEEKAINPYAVGMAAAKKSAGIKKHRDLPKSVIVKGHDIAKKIMKNEETEKLDEYEIVKVKGGYRDDEGNFVSDKEGGKQWQRSWYTRNNKNPERYTPSGSKTTSKSATKIYHNVAFKDKEAAKKEGMRFDGDKKKWYHTDASKSNASNFPKHKVEEALDYSKKTTDMLRGRIKGGKKDDVGPGADGKSTKVQFKVEHKGPELNTEPFVQNENPSSNPVVNKVKYTADRVMKRLRNEMLGKAGGTDEVTEKQYNIFKTKKK